MTGGETESPIRLPLSLRVLRRLSMPHKLGLLERLFGRGLARHGKTWVRCWNGVVWKLDLADVCHRWIVYGVYEGVGGISCARKALANGGVYIDSGANIGQWLLYLGGMPGVRCLAVEPLDSARVWLASCIDRQPGWRRHCDILDVGLGSEETTLALQVDGPRSTTRLDWYVDRGLERQTINLVPLEKVLNEKGIHRVEFWKLDMEGGEHAALLGAGRYLSPGSIHHIYFESNAADFPPIRTLLLHHGYEIYRLRGNRATKVVDENLSATESLLAMAA